MLFLDALTASGDERRQPVDHTDRTLDHDALGLGRDPRLGIRFEAALGLGKAAFEELVPFVQPGVAHLQILAPCSEHARSLFELCAQHRSCPRRFGLGLLVGLEAREQRFELGHAHPLPLDVGRGLGRRTAQGVELARRSRALPAARGSDPPTPR